MSDADADALARALIEADATARASLWQRVAAPGQLGWALKARIDAAWTSEPQSVAGIADVVAELALRSGDAQAHALAAWGRGIAHLVQGEMEPALAAIEQAAGHFAAQGRQHEMASMRVSQLMALAMLGRYEQAIECGVQARDVFVAGGDERSAGKIELNLGNLVYRRDQYEAAARHYRAAAARFAAAGDAEHGIMATKNLADTLARQHEFDAAAALYDTALAQAQDGGLALLTMLIEGDIGALEMVRSRFDRALHFLERSRRGCEALGSPHYLAVAEEALADAYLELRLLPEALTLYERSLATYEAAGMLADQAWALAQRGRALALTGDFAAARQSLERALSVFAAEDNAVGGALTHLWLAELALALGDAAAALRHAGAAEGPLLAARHMSGYLGARALSADALRLAGDHDAARAAAHQARNDATSVGLPMMQRRCDLTLGLLARDAGRAGDAEQHFRGAVAQIESQRGTLPGEEFRGAFFGDNLRAYHELARLALAREDTAQALGFVEQARARALADAMREDEGAADQGVDAAPRAIGRLRLRLNACYRQLARPVADGAGSNRLHDEVRRLESELLDAGRRDHQLGAVDHGPAGPAPALDLAALQAALGSQTALVEYFALDGELHAFVASDTGIVAQALNVAESQLVPAVEQLRFQAETLRHGAALLQHRMPELRRRVLYHLQRLHGWLWAPLLPHLAARRAVVVPHGCLHYLPFEALFDGARHEIERREMLRCPSAQVLLHCLARPTCRFESALLLGFADERLPHVAHEIDAVAAHFSAATRLENDAARTSALRAAAADVDVLHIACHGQFRSDNPRFSALHLADGALTARDAAHLRLRCGLLTMSACETGVSQVLPGNEAVGLTQAFLSAGAASALASLWTVQDAATAAFMARFYERLRIVRQPARALRETQIEVLATHPHPYYWSPFVLHGRW